MSLATMSFTTIVPLHNCNTYSSDPLQIVNYKENGPQDDQNQGDRGARIVANDHPGDLAPFVLLRSFAMRTVLRMTKIKGTEEHEFWQMTIC